MRGVVGDGLRSENFFIEIATTSHHDLQAKTMPAGAIKHYEITEPSTKYHFDEGRPNRPKTHHG